FYFFCLTFFLITCAPHLLSQRPAPPRKHPDTFPVACQPVCLCLWPLKSLRPPFYTHRHTHTHTHTDAHTDTPHTQAALTHTHTHNHTHTHTHNTHMSEENKHQPKYITTQ